VQPRLLQLSEISVRSYRCRLQADLYSRPHKSRSLNTHHPGCWDSALKKVFGNRFHSLLSPLFFGTVFFTDGLGFLVGDLSDLATLFLARGLASATAAICGLST
jgi:hypothetical protein